jgi:DNA-binding NtrC family response regulator
VGLKLELNRLKVRLGERDLRVPEMVAVSPVMTAVLKRLRTAASSDFPVLLEGESGTGKEVIARAIHAQGPLRDRPFVCVYCADMPPHLLDRELFGSTAADAEAAPERAKSKFAQAEGGTLFLDDVSLLEPALQAKLLRALSARHPASAVTADVLGPPRVISASASELAESVRRDRFRMDLYRRLSAFPIRVPPLRERREDIIELARFFLRRFAGQENRRVRGIQAEVEQALLSYEWPGNVQEMETMFYHAVVLAESETLALHDFPVLKLKSRGGAAPAGPLPAASAEGALALWRAEAGAIRQALATSSGNVSQAARLLHISRATLYRKSRKLNIPLR